jgi:molecular chaperone DnaK
MVKEAEQFSEQDRQKREEADLRNNADSVLYTVEKTKQDLKEKISKDSLDKLDKASTELRQALSGKDANDIRSKLDQLTKVLQEVGTAAYQQATSTQAQEGPQPGPQTSGYTESTRQDEHTVDADYKVVDENKDKK